MDTIAQANVKSIALEAVVIRADGTVEDLGTVAYWHQNPLKRLWARMKGIGPALPMSKIEDKN